MIGGRAWGWQGRGADGPRHSGFLLLIVLVAVLAGCAGASEKGPSERRQDGAVHRERDAGKDEEGPALEEMSPREMVGQMFVISVGGTQPDYYVEKMVREQNIGGVILFGHNMRSEAQVESFAGKLQELSMETEPAVPLFVAVDQEGGDIASAPWMLPQPSAAEIGRRGDPAEARAVAEEIGAQLVRAGVNTDFAPVVDTGFGAAIGNRSYGENPELVARMGAAAVEGFESSGVVSAAKHFPNHGPATSDSHVGVPVIEHDAATLRSYDLPPFRAAVRAGVPMVMVGHLIYPAIDPEKPASLSADAISMLREEIGFDGVVVTDDLAMAGASGGGPPARAAVEAVAAGADLLIVSSPPQEQAEAYEAVVAAVESREIPRERIRESVGRVLRVKDRYDLRGGRPH
ncbi:MAG TPA: glycoside hydrolase family 3 N-terminal domain-containing protein [Rubrobacter sp.]|nr:glycoside hydrolase family 3 N-terminal domain-containing protein [Rubrobacter sp.]